MPTRKTRFSSSRPSIQTNIGRHYKGLVSKLPGVIAFFAANMVLMGMPDTNGLHVMYHVARPLHVLCL
jgi:hypothetical protein